MYQTFFSKKKCTKLMYCFFSFNINPMLTNDNHCRRIIILSHFISYIRRFSLFETKSIKYCLQNEDRCTVREFQAFI